MDLRQKEWRKESYSFFCKGPPALANHDCREIESPSEKSTGSITGPEPKIEPSEPLWATFATANPVTTNGKKYPGIRACVAFHKVPCSFKMQTEGRGCLHCALSTVDRDVSFVDPKDQITAVAKAIENITAQLGRTPPILEVLPDGSFLNPEEVPPATREGIFRMVAANDDVVQISIESRPEHISAEKIIPLFHLLRPDQYIEIYVGLESIDPFVLHHVIEKGFTVAQFEQKIAEIAGTLPDEYKRRLVISVYHFFNPPYLTEKESIEAAIAMGRAVREYTRATNIHFSVKYEPAVISRGTFQWYLFERGEYTPPNYFSVAELIPIAYFEGFSDQIKFGQRDDIDDFQTVASIPSLENPQMLSAFDFMVYNAVQRFNADQDIWTFFADMQIAMECAPEFPAWEEAIYGSPGKSALSRMLAEYQGRGSTGDEYQGRIEFQKKVGRVLDRVEYGNPEIYRRLREQGREGAKAIPEILRSVFLDAGIRVLQTKKMTFFDTGKIHGAPALPDTHPDFSGATGEAVYQAEIIIGNEAGLPQSVWIKVPIHQI